MSSTTTSDVSNGSAQKPRKPSVWQAFTHPAAWTMFLFGFSSGLPFLLVAGTLAYWLKEHGVVLNDITKIASAGHVLCAQVPVGAVARSLAIAAVCAPGTTARLAAFRAVWSCSGPGYDGAIDTAQLSLFVYATTRRGLLRCHAGHRSRCLPHRDCTCRSAGRACRDVLAGLSPRSAQCRGAGAHSR
jgi:hypothetical protein